jgi:hypothetical protein
LLIEAGKLFGIALRRPIRIGLSLRLLRFGLFGRVPLRLPGLAFGRVLRPRILRSVLPRLLLRLLRVTLRLFSLLTVGLRRVSLALALPGFLLLLALLVLLLVLLLLLLLFEKLLDLLLVIKRILVSGVIAQQRFVGL